MSLYSTLNCSNTVSFSDLKKNYQELLIRHHPDKNNGNQSETFISVNKAWKVLSDDRLRAIYDAEQSNCKLESCQDSAIWNTFHMTDLRDEDGLLTVTCRCGGQYQVGVEEVQQLTFEGEKEVLVDCDTCSLNILVLI